MCRVVLYLFFESRYTTIYNFIRGYAFYHYLLLVLSFLSLVYIQFFKYASIQISLSNVRDII